MVIIMVIISEMMVTDGHNDGDDARYDDNLWS